MDASVLVHEATNAWMPPGLERPPPDLNVARARAEVHSFNIPNSTASTSNPGRSDSTPSPPSGDNLTFSQPITDGSSTIEQDSEHGAMGDLQPVQDTPASVREYAIQNGHSTPDMAGKFAKSIRARGLFMTHFSTRFPDAGSDPRLRHPDDSVPQSSRFRYRQRLYTHRKSVMAEIERQATKAWGSSKTSAVAARDLLNVRIPAVEPEDEY